MRVRESDSSKRTPRFLEVCSGAMMSDPIEILGGEIHDPCLDWMSMNSVLLSFNFNACLQPKKCLSVGVKTGKPLTGQVQLGIICIQMKISIMSADDVTQRLRIYSKQPQGSKEPCLIIGEPTT